MAKKDNKAVRNIMNFISEAGMLKRTRRSGWSVLGIENAETVADHSFRCAVIGYIIAHAEKITPYKVVIMALFNDIHEARITDLHKMAQRYIDGASAENKAFHEQVSSLPRGIKSELISMRKEYVEQKTRESIIARDADILECLIQAKEYHEHGFNEALKFMKKAPSYLKTETAKKIWRFISKNDLNDWWIKLSDFKR